MRYDAIAMFAELYAREICAGTCILYLRRTSVFQSILNNKIFCSLNLRIGYNEAVATLELIRINHL